MIACCNSCDSFLSNQRHYATAILVYDFIARAVTAYFFLRMANPFFKLGQSRPLFGYFRYFLDRISIIQIKKSIDGVLGIRTLGRRMVGADETTELWRPPRNGPSLPYSFYIRSFNAI